MAYACDICGKGKQFGHNIRHKHSGGWARKAPKTQNVWKPNLQHHHLFIDGSRVAVKVCTSCWRTLAKYQKTPETEAVTKEPATKK